ncbi:MAG: glycoside hydrolase, partial [Planctomycetes bacterium]|nr:glycoside hydrolase [Planctomycetota bacterium]
QPYAVINRSGEWVVVMTTGSGKEGQPGQHIVSTISKDRGKTWSRLYDIEPPQGPEASWVTPFLAPSGRIYVFYTYNSENMREVLNSSSVPIQRVDTLGKMAMKYSDDGGYSWSANRTYIPIRNFELDQRNIYQGKIQFFWSVARPIAHRGMMILPLSKVGNFGDGFMESGTGAFVASTNILSESAPDLIEWQTLPDGNTGLLPPEGLVGDEHNIVPLSDGSLYCVFRTNLGRNVQAYSRDHGRTWTKPEWATYTPGGKQMKQPRCFNKVHRFTNGKYALFFHNNGGRHYAPHPLGNRNPTWLAGGIEKDGYIHWSQPEVFLYDDNFANGISYPDWIEDQGEYFLTETQKKKARVHQIPATFLETLWKQADNHALTKQGLALELAADACAPGVPFSMPRLKSLVRSDGFSLELRLKPIDVESDQLILDTRRERTDGVGSAAAFAGNGIKISLLKGGAVEILLEDGRSPLLWSTTPGLLRSNTEHHLIFNVDAQAKILTILVDGDLWDGGNRPFGYARFNPFLDNVDGEPTVSFSERFRGNIKSFRVYQRCLLTSEAIGNFRSGK